MAKRFFDSLDARRKSAVGAMMMQWRKCLQVELLILNQIEGCTPDMLEDFCMLFWDYINAAVLDPKSVDEMVKQFEGETNLFLDETKLYGTTVDRYKRESIVQCIKIGAIILWSVPKWSKANVRAFVYKCWDDIPRWAELKPEINKFERTVGIKVR